MTIDPSVQQHPYFEFIARVEKPVRYLGGEHGTVRKDWDSTPVRCALAFPDLYDIGMSHLGFKLLYGILNAAPGVLAERAYAPWTDLEAELRTRQLPLLSLENARPLRDFDVVGFSLQFELTYTNVLLMLDLGGIPLRSADRTDSDPLVLAGGPTATHGEPMAPFVDAFAIGDGEEVFLQIARTWVALRAAGVPRAERLHRLSTITGVYVPALYATVVCPQSGFEVVDEPIHPDVPRTVRRAFVPDINQYPFPGNGPVAATETVFDRVSVEIARGCTEGCRFCQAGMIYRPVRERSPESILATIDQAVRVGGYDEASLTCLSTADYSSIAPLVRSVMERLEGQKVSLSVSSLRAYGLSEDLLDEIEKVRATGLTFAPEAGSQRMRDVVNKNVTEEQLMETAERVFSRGWSKMKLYFMIGLPTEQDEDVLGIVETGRKARDVGRKVHKGRPPTVTVSVSTHVPKPHTPFQWCAMDSLDEIVRKQTLLRQAARDRRVDLRLHESRGSVIEGVLARGDRRLADVIEHAYRHGARFDSWEDRLNVSAWNNAFAQCNVRQELCLGTIPIDGRLPWDHIDVGLAPGFLLREYRKSVSNRLSPPCGKAYGMNVHHTNLQEATADKRKLVCYDCGVSCDLTAMREERLVFLGQLGAAEPRLRNAEPAPAPRTREPRRSAPQGEAQRYRIAFRRIGRAAFQGHLDLIRALPRVFRRAGLEMHYSQGFHPKPSMTFGPALALGIATLDEYVDVRLIGDVDPVHLACALRDAAPEGMMFSSAARLGQLDPGLNKVIDATCYVAALPLGALRASGLNDVTVAREHIRERRSGEMVVHRRIEGIGRSVNVAIYLADVEWNVGGEALLAAGLVGGLVPVRFLTRVSPNGTCKPAEVIEVLLNAEMPARFVRVAQGLLESDGSIVAPMDLERIRGRVLAEKEREKVSLATADAAE